MRIHSYNFLIKKISQEHAVDHCVNVTKNYQKICLKLSGIGNHYITRTGVVSIVKLFAVLIPTIAGKFKRRFRVGSG